MNFIPQLVQFKVQQEESLVWKLLRADNAPYILAFISALFSEDKEIPYTQARLKLDHYIKEGLQQNFWNAGEQSASDYLRAWIYEGWLRESNDHLLTTDASEIALRFVYSLQERRLGTTASHFRIVQEAVRDLTITLTQNVKERIALLQAEQIALQREIDDLQQYGIVPLKSEEKREKILEVFYLASQLTDDFRKIEEEIRQLDQSIRMKMIEQNRTKGEILTQILEAEETLFNKTEAGSSFESFYKLLCDAHHFNEFRLQLRHLVKSELGQYLKPTQQKYLYSLAQVLSREGERVRSIRRKTTESLRTFIEHDLYEDNQAVAKLIMRLERRLLQLKSEGVDVRNHLLPLSLPTGIPVITSPMSMRLRTPDEEIEVGNIVTQKNSRTVSATILNYLETVNILELAQKVKSLLIERNTALSIGQILEDLPPRFGLEEVVAHIRIARRIGAPQLPLQESIRVADQYGDFVLKLPKIVLSATQFPDDFNEWMV
ncbi:hypothetical protein B9T19_04755 [Ignatzschineria sp. F8392]|uniref:DUF3375 domain-containing protein n=1 Tax=Ignatzschineria sp. F8392 TaxID=1980117 RepID=UPI000B97E12D|nr:DUF3375 domain-containing protein [Ignatzschineria sp. F8392]OYQ80559.1 hypothetical protein B9T19_04755 [Ignatzschineria sp. F8392]